MAKNITIPAPEPMNIEDLERAIDLLIDKINTTKDELHLLFNRISTLEERLTELESG